MKKGFQHLSLDSGFSLGEEAFVEIVQRFRAAKARSIVEFGSGISTARLALEFSSAQILSVEHSREFLSVTDGYLRGLQLHNLVRLDLRPVRWRRIGPGFFRTYARGEFPAFADAILIDGPPGWMYRGREACLYDVWNFLQVGGVLIMDDYERPSERATGAAWMAALADGAEFEEVHVGHGLLVVWKKKRSYPKLWCFQLTLANLTSYWYFSKSTARLILKASCGARTNSGVGRTSGSCP